VKSYFSLLLTYIFQFIHWCLASTSWSSWRLVRRFWRSSLQRFCDEQRYCHWRCCKLRKQLESLWLQQHKVVVWTWKIITYCWIELLEILRLYEMELDSMIELSLIGITLITALNSSPCVYWLYYSNNCNYQHVFRWSECRTTIPLYFITAGVASLMWPRGI